VIVILIVSCFPGRFPLHSLLRVSKADFVMEAKHEGGGVLAKAMDRLLLRNVLRPNAPVADILKALPSILRSVDKIG
jgi:hypothetical protein